MNNLLYTIVCCFLACSHSFVYAQDYSASEWPDTEDFKDDNKPSDAPTTNSEPKVPIKPVVLEDSAGEKSTSTKIDSKYDVPLSSVIVGAPKLTNKAKIIPKLKVREVYDYRNNTMPKFFQNTKYNDNNRHLPKIFYQVDYSMLLFDAVSKANIGAINTLLERGADINAKFSNVGLTPLMVATDTKTISLVKYLVLKGADLGAQNSKQQTALHIAAQNQSGEIFKLMFQNGASYDIEDADGKTPLDYLSPTLRGSIIIAGLSTQQELDAALLQFVNISDVSGVKLIIDKGGNINTKDSHGNTPLQLATQKQDVEMVSLLLYYGANPIMKNKDGKDSYLAALGGDSKEIVQLIDTYIIKQELETGVQYLRPRPAVVERVVPLEVVDMEQDEMNQPITTEAIYERKLDAELPVKAISDRPSQPKSIIPAHLQY